MQGYAVLLVAMAAVCATVAFNELLTWTRLRGHGSDVAFALICVAAALFDAACAGEYNVRLPIQSVPWLRVQSVGLSLIGFTFGWYLSERTGMVPRGQLVALGCWYGLGVLAQTIGLGDLTWESGQPLITRVDLPFGLSVTYREVEAGLVTSIQYVTGMLLFAYYLSVVVRYARSGHHRQAGPLFVMIGVVCAAYLNDVAVSEGLYSFLYCVEYAWLALVIFIGLQRSRQLIEAAAVKQELLDSEERFRLFIEQASESILMSDEQGRVMECNPAAERLTGLSRQRILGTPIWEVGVRRSGSGMGEGRYRQLVGSGGEALSGGQVEDELERPDGTVRTVRQNLFAIRTGKGYRIGSIGYDVTEIRRTEEALRESERRYRAIFESLQDVYFRTDAQGVVRLVSPSARATFGLDSGEVVGRPIAEFIGERGQEQAILGRIAQTGSISDQELRLRGTEGRSYEVSLSAHWLLDGQGRLQGYEGMLRDITDRKRAEEKVLASLEEKSMLLKEIHHRVKNNLQIISSLLFLQESRVVEASYRGILRECRNQVLSMAMIHEDLYRSADFRSIDFASYMRNLATRLLNLYGTGPAQGAAPGASSPAQGAVQQPAQRAVVKLRAEVEEIRLGIDKAIPCGLIVNELCTNALKYAFRGVGMQGREGELRVELHRVGEGRVRLTVADNGVGLPEGVEFREAGTLGMQIVSGLVEQLRGRLSVERETGTRIDIVFPES